MTGPRLAHDWHDAALPANIVLGRDVYIDSSYGFTRFFSEQQPGLTMGAASGLYQFNGSIATGPEAVVRIGDYSCLNNCSVMAYRSIDIGAFCLIAWRTVITDVRTPGVTTLRQRQRALADAAEDPRRRPPPLGVIAPVRIEDCVWIGFGAVVCGGVTIGRGAIVGSKTVIVEDVPPYAVVAGDPPRVIRNLDPTDTDEARVHALKVFGRCHP